MEEKCETKKETNRIIKEIPKSIKCSEIVNTLYMKKQRMNCVIMANKPVFPQQTNMLTDHISNDPRAQFFPNQSNKQ